MAYKFLRRGNEDGPIKSFSFEDLAKDAAMVALYALIGDRCVHSLLSGTNFTVQLDSTNQHG